MITGFTYSLANIEQLLGIIILVIQIIWFGIKCYCKIREMLKDGITIDELNEIEEDVKEFTEEVKQNEHNTKS